MNKQQIVKAAAKKAGLSVQQTKKIIDAFLDSITEAIEEGEEVLIKGFGKFGPKQIKPRRIVDFKSGENLEIKAVKSMHFKPSSAIKKRFNQ